MLAPKAKVIEGELGRLDSWRRMLEVESSECLTMSAGCWVLGAGCWVLKFHTLLMGSIGHQAIAIEICRLSSNGS